MPTVFVPFLNRTYNHNPKGSATVEVTMASAMPFDRPVSITQAANVPVAQPMQVLPGTSAAQVSRTRAKHLRRPPMSAANVSGIGDDPAPASSWTDVVSSGAKELASATAKRAADAIAKQKKAKAPAKLPKFVTNVPKTNWMIVGVAAVVALGGGLMLMRGKGGKGGSRRRR